MRKTVYILLTLCLGVVVGCGPARPDGMPNLYPVTLTFTQEGIPIADAAVQLRDENATSPFAAGGVTDANGVLIVQTHGQYRGAPEGTYTITIQKEKIVKTGPWDQIPQDDETAIQNFLAAHRKELKSEAFHVVPAKYRNSSTSDLKITVDRKGVMQTFELGPAVRDRIESN